MLHDVAVWSVLEQPTRKNALPRLAAMVEHDQLNEGTGFLWHFPLRGPFTGAQTHDRPPNADAFTRAQRDVAHQAVAFIEEAEHRHAPFHCGDAGIGVIRSSRDGRSFWDRWVGFSCRLLISGAVTSSKADKS